MNCALCRNPIDDKAVCPSCYEKRVAETAEMGKRADLQHQWAVTHYRALERTKKNLAASEAMRLQAEERIAELQAELTQEKERARAYRNEIIELERQCLEVHPD